MRKTFTLLLLTILTFNFVNAQQTKDLYMPKEIKQAYKNRTRSYDGTPGDNYFQNSTDYVIKAEFDPKTRWLTGEETITYKNNSHDDLNMLFINLYQDIFKKGSSRLWDLGTVDLHDGVEILSLKIDGKEIDMQSRQVRRNSTLLMVRLQNNIKAKSESKIEIKWKLIIPGTIPIRMGTYHENNFMIAYWYPKIAVYDDIVGWNTVPYTGSLEFYHDYGDFDVEITVPSEYKVLSSGLLQNADQIFTDTYLTRIEEAKKSDKIIHVIGKEDIENKNITKKAEKHTWKFKAKQMSDFAFTVFSDYLWDATSVKVGDKRVAIHAVYFKDSKDFYKVAEISKNTINYFSTQTPAIKYPYPQMVAFNGSGGMEFPGMINDGDARDLNGTVYLTSHEIGHSYFPFNVGTNEQKYAWVDEGLISFFPRKVIAEFTDEENYMLFKEIPEGYNSSAGTFQEIPLIVSSESSGKSYRYQAYIRSATAFYTLHELIGADKFNKALQEYTKQWKSKHPTPYDLFFTFNEVVGEDLAWFWKPWFFEMGYADLAIDKIVDKSDKKEIIIKNKGGFPVQIRLTAIYKNGEETKFEESARVWKNGKKTFNIEIPAKEIKEIVLDNTLTPDANTEDNIWTAPHALSEKLMKKYAGTYGPRNIIYEKGKLYYQRKGKQKMEMIPIEDNYFRFNEIGYFRIKVIVEDGKVIALEGNYSDGRTDRNDRNDI